MQNLTPRGADGRGCRPPEGKRRILEYLNPKFDLVKCPSAAHANVSPTLPMSDIKFAKEKWQNA